MPDIRRIHFSILIHAPVATVWHAMLDPEPYEHWTAAFTPGSRYEGSWEQGQRIRFLAPSGDGMLAEIAENRPQEYLSIRHLGHILQGVEDTDSDAVRAWAPAFENYTFRPVPDGTELLIEQDVTEEFERYLLDAWPRALERLKKLCESGRSI